MNADTNTMPAERTTPPSMGIERLINVLRALRGEAGTLVPGFFDNNNRAFLGCCQEVERAVLARCKQIPRAPPKLPLATIRALGRTGPYQLIDDHGTWRQELCFADPLAAQLFILTLRGSGPAPGGRS
jgi:hypothetical protein